MLVPQKPAAPPLVAHCCADYRAAGGVTQCYTRGPSPDYSKLPQYLWGMAWEWILPGLIWLGIRNRVSLRALIGGRGRTMEEFPRDVIYAALFWICALGVLGLGPKLMHLDQAGSKA